MLRREQRRGGAKAGERLSAALCALGVVLACAVPGCTGPGLDPPKDGVRANHGPTGNQKSDAGTHQGGSDMGSHQGTGGSSTTGNSGSGSGGSTGGASGSGGTSGGSGGAPPVITQDAGVPAFDAGQEEDAG